MSVGIILLIITAVLWVVQGSVISASAEKKLNFSALQMLMSVILMAFTLPLFAIVGKIDTVIVISLIVAGIANCGAFQLMNTAMKNGPHGMTWAISQSAFAVPFLMGIFVFQVPCSIIRGISLALLVISMAVMGIFGKKDGNVKEGSRFKWTWLCLCAYLVIGISQCGGSLPSYFVNDSANTIWHVLVRVGILNIGVFIGSLFNFAIFERTPIFKAGFITQTLLLTFSTVLGCILMFHAFDIITEIGAGAIGYPIVTGLSIAFFFIYTAVKLKERPSIPAIIGVLLCLSSIISIIF